MSAVNRDAVFQYARDRFASEPEYLWLSSPDSAVLRRADNAKWYAITMNVPRTRLGLPGDGAADILNVKCDPILIGSLREMPGFLPAWHMNKHSWISILLDGTASMEQIVQLLEMSYDLAGIQGKTRRTPPPSDIPLPTSIHRSDL